MMELPNPSPHISKMSQGQLRDLVEELVQIVIRDRKAIPPGDVKPTWWPPDVSWSHSRLRTRRSSQQLLTHQAEALRKVVRSCYKHHGQENRLDKPGSSKPNVTETVIKNNDNSKMPAIGSCPSGPVPTSGPFQSKDWKIICPESAALPEAEASVFTKMNVDEKPLIEVYMCFYCEQEFDGRNKLQKHQRTCSKNTATKSQKTLPKLRSSARFKCNDIHPDTHQRQDVKPFMESLGLVPKSKLATIQKRRTKEVKVDEIEVDERPMPKTPTTPRSNKSLISQLSRDLSPPPSASKLLSPKPKVEESVRDGLERVDELELEADNADADSVCSNKSDNLESEFNPRRLTSLLAIDLCSPLGQRVKKHVDKLDNSEKSPYEEYCHTPVKNKALDRLRNRPNMFPVTFRKSKRLCPKQCHWYKFTKEDRKEFLRICATGLNKRARLLKRLIKPCKVVLAQLKEKDIEYWTTPKKRAAILQFPGGHVGLYRNLPYRLHSSALVQELQRAPLSAQRQSGNIQQFVRLGERAQRQYIQGYSVNQPQRLGPYKPVLNNVQNPHNSLSVYHLPLRNPPANRNFGKPLQVTGFYGPHNRPMVMNSRGQRPNILSKENGEAWRNTVRAARRLNMEGLAKGHGGGLTAEYLNQLPSSGGRKRQDDDVISISSTESDTEPIVVPVQRSAAQAKRPAPEDGNNNSPPKKRQCVSQPSGGGGGGGDGGGGTAASNNSQIILFRCHLCQAEITCSLGQTNFIQKHFSEKHSVNNIHLLEQTDSNNQKVVTIVEDNPVAPAPPASKPECNAPTVRVNHQEEVNRRNRLNAAQGPGVIRRTVRNGETAHVHTSRHQLDNRKNRTSAIDISGPPEIIVLD